MKYDLEKVAKAAALGVMISAGLSSMATAASTLVINELYTSGGSTSAPLTGDFVEIYNSGASAVSLNGYFLQYASSSGAFSSASSLSANFAFPTDASIAPGGYYVVQGSTGVAGTAATALSSFQATSGLNLSGSVGKIRLTTSLGTDALSSAGTIIDFVGYGPTATTGGPSLYEGSSWANPGGATTFTASFQRIPNGTDTDSNSANFGYGAYTPGAVNSVPEPTTLGLVATAGALLVGRRRKA